MHNQQNIQPGYLLHTLLTAFIGILASVGMLQCGCNQASESARNKLELKIAASNTLVKAPEKEFEVIITAAEGSPLPPLTDLKLQAHFLQQETLEKDVKSSQASYLAYKHAADKQHFTTSFIIPLTQYATSTKSQEEKEQNELRIPIVLQPNNQATKLKVGIDLLDKENNVLQSIEVSWIKNELLITEPTVIEKQEGLVSLTLKNTKDIPLKTHQLILNLASDHGDTCLFSQTHTAQARLDELWDHRPSLDPGAQTSPLSFKLSKADGNQALSNLTISISQEDGNVLASKTVACPSAPTKATKSLPLQAQKEEYQQQPDYLTTLPNIQLKLIPVNNKTFKLCLENKGQKVSKKLLELVKLNYSIQGTGDITKVQFNGRGLADINGASLAELIGSSLQKGQTKELEIVLQADTADSLTIHFSLKETQNSNLVTFTWYKQEKQSQEVKDVEEQKKIEQPIKNLQEKVEIKEEIDVKEKVEEQAQQPIENLQEKVETKAEIEEEIEIKENVQGQEKGQQPIKNLQEKVEPKVEPKEAVPSSLPDLQMQLEASNKSPKIFKLVVTNQGESISANIMKHVKLSYILEGRGDITTAYLKRRGAPQEDINGKRLLDFTRSGLSKGQTKEFEIIIETGSTQALTIYITLAGTQSPHTAIFNWISKKAWQGSSDPIQDPKQSPFSKEEEQIKEAASDLQIEQQQDRIQAQASDQQAGSNSQEDIKQAINTHKGDQEKIQEFVDRFEEIKRNIAKNKETLFEEGFQRKVETPENTKSGSCKTQ